MNINEVNVREVIAEAGGTPAVARQLGINPVSVYEWIEKNKLPGDRVIPVSEMTNWVYTPHMLDAGLYPNKTDGILFEVLK